MCDLLDSSMLSMPMLKTTTATDSYIYCMWNTFETSQILNTWTISLDLEEHPSLAVSFRRKLQPPRSTDCCPPDWSIYVQECVDSLERQRMSLLVGGLVAIFCMFPYIGFLIIPIDFHIFQRGSNHQPDCFSPISPISRPQWSGAPGEPSKAYQNHKMSLSDGNPTIPLFIIFLKVQIATMRNDAKKEQQKARLVPTDPKNKNPQRVWPKDPEIWFSWC